MNKYVRYYDTVCSVCKDKHGDRCELFRCPVVDALENCVALNRYELPNNQTRPLRKGIGNRHSEAMFNQDKMGTGHRVRHSTKYEVKNSVTSYKLAQEAKKEILARMSATD